MNWDRIEGNWKHLQDKAKAQWGKLTDDHLDAIAGKRDRLVGQGSGAVRSRQGRGREAGS